MTPKLSAWLTRVITDWRAGSGRKTRCAPMASPSGYAPATSLSTEVAAACHRMGPSAATTERGRPRMGSFGLEEFLEYKYKTVNWAVASG
jgi:hypothetical protein